MPITFRVEFHSVILLAPSIVVDGAIGSGIGSASEEDASGIEPVSGADQSGEGGSEQGGPGYPGSGQDGSATDGSGALGSGEDGSSEDVSGIGSGFGAGIFSFFLTNLI